jgi:hypothetical protein
MTTPAVPEFFRVGAGSSRTASRSCGRPRRPQSFPVREDPEWIPPDSADGTTIPAERMAIGTVRSSLLADGSGKDPGRPDKITDRA